MQEDDNIPLSAFVECFSLKVNEVIDVDSRLEIEDNCDNQEKALLEWHQLPHEEQIDEEQECEEDSSLPGIDMIMSNVLEFAKRLW